MTGTSFIDVAGVAVVALLGSVTALALLGIAWTIVYGFFMGLTRGRPYDHRDYGSSPDWPGGPR